MDHLNVTSSYMCSFLSITSNYFLHHIHPFWVHGIYRAMNGAHILASIERGLQTFFYRMSLHCIWTRKGSLIFVMINTCRCIYTSSRWNYLGCICILPLCTSLFIVWNEPLQAFVVMVSLYCQMTNPILLSPSLSILMFLYDNMKWLVLYVHITS